MNLNEKIRKATTHISQNEGLIFEKSSPGKKAYKLPPLDVPEIDAAQSCWVRRRAKTLARCPR